MMKKITFLMSALLCTMMSFAGTLGDYSKITNSATLQQTEPTNPTTGVFSVGEG